MSIYSDYGVSDSSSKKANQLQAAITRAQYDDYQKRFAPYLDTLTSQVSDSQIAADKSKWNNTFLNQAQSNGLTAQAMTSRDLGRYGVSNDNRTKDTSKRLADINATSNAVSNMNTMNQSIDDRVMSLLSGQKLSSQ